MDLHQSIAKAFSLAAFFGLTFTSEEPGSTGAAVVLASPAPAPGMLAAPAPLPSLLSADAPTSTTTTGSCEQGMVLVEGEYCPEVEQVCMKWLDPPPYQNLRCGEYAKPATCKGTRQHRRFCIDREEFAEAAPSPCPGEASATCMMPLVNKNWGDAKALCGARGARLCKESEWEFACEGPDMTPYPYGWKRDSNICNLDKTDLGGPEEKLKDLRAPLSAFPDCKSPFGIHDMVGNVDEWVERENMPAPYRSSLRGGWWLPGRNRCRAATTAHPESYGGKQVGFRCCKDAP